jgi:hypothetical protein
MERAYGYKMSAYPVRYEDASVASAILHTKERNIKEADVT